MFLTKVLGELPKETPNAFDAFLGSIGNSFISFSLNLWEVSQIYRLTLTRTQEETL